MQRSVVDFPQPDGPNSVKKSPDSTSKDIPCTALTCPWSVVNSLKRSVTLRATDATTHPLCARLGGQGLGLRCRQLAAPASPNPLMSLNGRMVTNRAPHVKSGPPQPSPRHG